jgi:hypothetical protein
VRFLGLHFVVRGVVVHVAAGEEHGPGQAAGNDRVLEVSLGVEDSGGAFLHPLRVNSEFAGDKALDFGCNGSSKEMRHRVPDDIDVDSCGDEDGVGVLENLCEFCDVVVGATVPVPVLHFFGAGRARYVR